MEDSSNYYVVKKGDMVGVYKNLNDCQAQICSSISGPAACAYKGSCWSKEKEEYLSSCGLINASYITHAADLREDLLGTLVPFTVEKVCVLHFDGASMGSPGESGAGAVLKTEEGRVISRLREGLGVSINNVAEYRGLVLGLKCAIRHGFKRIKVYGNSQLVCQQVDGTYQAKKAYKMELCTVRQLQESFDSFEINMVEKTSNVEADGEAKIGIKLEKGVVSEERGDVYYKI